VYAFFWVLFYERLRKLVDLVSLSRIPNYLDEFQASEGNWDISVGIVTRLGAGRPRSPGSFSGRVKRFPLPYKVQIYFVAHPVSYTVGTGVKVVAT
jgi:hypothetical protein